MLKHTIDAIAQALSFNNSESFSKAYKKNKNSSFLLYKAT